jgi:4-amino-4-deoxy-L-arabinose transferase-like glycosyltransferase
MTAHLTRIRLEHWLLSAILLLALGLRLAAIDYDLPDIYHPDEPAVIRISREMFATGDLNPHFFDYPSLSFYSNALAYAPLYLSGRLTGAFDDRADILPLQSVTLGTVRAPQPAAVLLNRGVSLVMGVGAVALLYLIGRILYDRPNVGLIGALLLAVAPNHTYHSRIVTTDAMVTFFILLTMLMAALIFRQGRTRHYVLAGLAVGLAAGTKYNGAMIALVVPLAHFLRAGWGGWRDGRLYAAGLAAVAVFLLTTPYAILDYPAFSTAVLGVVGHYDRGHAGMDGHPLAWYAAFLWSTTTLLPLLAVAQIGRGLWQRSRPTLLLAAYPVVYFLFILRFEVRNDRTILPIVPFLFLLAAVVLADLLALTAQAHSRPARLAATALAVGLLAATVLYPATLTLRENRVLAGELSLETAAVWLAANLEPGARVAVGAYSPFVDQSDFDVVGFNSLIDDPPAWFAAQGFDYVIAASGMYGRFYREPARYAAEIAHYDRLFAALELVRVFDDGFNEVRVYRVR